MPNYELGKIYKIIDNTNGNIYVGSTSEPTLARRLCKHKASYNCWLNPNIKQGKMRSFDIIKNGDFKIILLEDWPCQSKDQLCAREQFWMDQLVCINKNNAVHDSVEYQKQYQKNNREKLNKASQNWVKNNKDKRAEIIKKYNSKEENKKKKSIHHSKVREYKKSFGGDIRGDNCNLLKIDISLFD